MNPVTLIPYLDPTLVKDNSKEGKRVSVPLLMRHVWRNPRNLLSTVLLYINISKTFTYSIPLQSSWSLIRLRLKTLIYRLEIKKDTVKTHDILRWVNILQSNIVRKTTHGSPHASKREWHFVYGVLVICD